MPPRSIYPSIPDPGNTPSTMLPTLLAVKQTLQMILLNSQKPNPNYTPSSAAQIFVTNQRLAELGIAGAIPSSTATQDPQSAASLLSEINALKARVASLEAKVP